MADWDRKPGFDLTGKNAIVVGFANPLGRAIARALGEAGADLITASATLDGDEIMEAKFAAKDIARLGRASYAQGWDVTLGTNVQVGLKQAIKELGHPTILFFNADSPLARPIEQTTDSDIGRVLQTNLAGAINTARSFIRELPEGQPGRLVFLTGIVGERGVSDSAVYAAARAGVIGLAKALSQEVAARGITVNCIAHGWMESAPGRGSDDPAENLLLRFLPQRRFGRAEDVAGLAVFLASDASGFVNGAVIHVDGGAAQHL